jgi:Sulfotransferase family
MKIQPEIEVNGDKTERKHIFVCGLPRSGTSVLGRNVARLENCTGFKNTGVLEDEGQFVQDVYASDHELGGAGSFGFHPAAHLTEASELLTPQNAARLRSCWEGYWDSSKSIRVEKTPSNLLMTRFLQEVFTNPYFIVIRRHPVAVSMATQKWKDSVQSLSRLFQHWLHCHYLFEQDKKHLKHVYELTYEDYIKDSDKFHREIAAFIGTRIQEPPNEDKFRFVTEWRNPVGRRVPESAMEETSAAHNQKYFDRWSKLLRDSFFKSYYRYIAEKYEASFAKHGYSLTEGMGLAKDQLRVEGKVNAVLGRLFCLGADTGALMRRLLARAKEWLRIKCKVILPEFVVDKIRYARRTSANIVSPNV